MYRSSGGYRGQWTDLLMKNPAPWSTWSRLRLVLVGATVGCGASTPQPTKPVVQLEGTELRVAARRGSPLANAISLRLGEWDARTGSKTSLTEVDAFDPEADLNIVSGAELAALNDLPGIPTEILDDPELRYASIPAVYRLVFAKRNEQTIAMPLATDRLLLWYRSDLFADEAISADFEQKTGARLAVPSTWEELVRLASFFRATSGIEYGCVAATDSSADAARNYLAVCAAYAKGPNWSSFAIDAETGQPRLGGPAFRLALSEWLALTATSPAADGTPIDEATARALFCDGKAAMFIGRIPPTIGRREKSSVADSPIETFAVANLPGSKTLFDPESGTATELEEVNRPVHFATTGWFVVLGATPQRAAAERLLAFLADHDDIFYLVQGCRDGILPLRPALLNEPQRYRRFGLPSGAVARMFELLAKGLRTENWVADLRTANAEQFAESLARNLHAAQMGELTAEEALAKTNREWTATIDVDRARFLGEYRETLGLPELLK